MTTALPRSRPDLSCRRGGRPVFEGLSFALAGGELLALTGRNGSGKTTLLRALALLVTAEAGADPLAGRRRRRDREAWRRQIAWLGHLDGLKGDLTVRENLAIAAKLRDDARRPRSTRPSRPSISHPSPTAPVRTLSAGQRRRAALARVASADAPLWLLDEPLNALDAPSQAALRAVLARHLAAGGLAIAATHAPLDMPARALLELGA